jgi:hypothetical protein
MFQLIRKTGIVIVLINIICLGYLILNSDNCVIPMKGLLLIVLLLALIGAKTSIFWYLNLIVWSLYLIVVLSEFFISKSIYTSSFNYGINTYLDLPSNTLLSHLLELISFLYPIFLIVGLFTRTAKKYYGMRHG